MLPESRRHTHEYKVRLTEAEAAAVDALAGIVGVPPAVYLRLLITHQLVEQANHIPIFTAHGGELEVPTRTD